MGRNLEPFTEKLKRAHLPKREIQVSMGHYYWRKCSSTYVVTKHTHRNKERSFLYYTSTPSEEVAKAASITMCEMINDEIRRRDAR